MTISLRRIRAVVTSGLIWASIGGVASAVFTLIASLLNGNPLRLTELIMVVRGWVFFGFVAGSLFALFLAWLQRGRDLAHLSMVRSAVAGFVGGALFGTLLVSLDGAFNLIGVLGQSLITGGMGMVAGIGFVSIARRSALRLNSATPGPTPLARD